MWQLLAILSLVVAASGSAKPAKVATMKDLVFLTRDGCVNTPDMVKRLDDALKALSWPTDYQYIDIGKLPKKDARTGYPRGCPVRC